ncbi:Retrovirus-related Pol polyprotein from transposon RE1 [Vitis vinifera]|uniref:Retrovirus-related Pol polyprotein from transposon RE1 n=1 Tax=Vitis vinifera TaxID=29760 RepID=A0A438F9C3_VITVI|nr:Retrovirus-related Pol polyprotein from transposon RE1 [Vitis vinifera]RVX23071.1 Retrovirus-related Pol polyprotein from transposon RE1 [Vitis vinifera]
MEENEDLTFLHLPITSPTDNIDTTNSQPTNSDPPLSPMSKSKGEIQEKVGPSITLPLQQFDVKNAFLHGDLEEKVYMDAPPELNKRFTTNHVCKLKNALYGLKQSPRAWFGRFTKAMIEMEFYQSQGDHTLFVKRSSFGKITTLIVYVDDIIVTGDDLEEINQLK